MDQLVGPDWGWPRYQWRASSLINNNKSWFKWKLVGKMKAFCKVRKIVITVFFLFCNKGISCTININKSNFTLFSIKQPRLFERKWKNSTLDGKQMASGKTLTLSQEADKYLRAVICKTESLFSQLLIYWNLIVNIYN